MYTKLLFYKDNFKFKWGDHDVFKWTKQIFKKNFEIEEFAENTEGETIVFFDDFTDQKHIDKLKNLNEKNKIILVVTEYFTKFKNFYSLNYFEKRNLSLYLTKIAFFTNLINILISILRVFVYEFDKKKIFKLLIFFSLANIYLLFFSIYFFGLKLQNHFYLFLFFLTPFILVLIFLIFNKIISITIKFIENWNLKLNIDQNVYFLKRYKGIFEALKYTDHIIFCDKNVENSFFENFPFSEKFSKKYSTINFYEVLEDQNFDPEKNIFCINTFGEVNPHRVLTFKKILNFGTKYKKIKVSERKKLINNYIFKNFERKNINSKIGIIIPKSDLNPYLSTGAIIRHFNNSSVPIFFNFKNNKEFYLNPDDCSIIQNEKKLFEIFNNFKEIVDETSKKYIRLKQEAKNQNEIVSEKLKMLNI